MSMDFMSYAHLQLAQDGKAKALIDELSNVSKDEILRQANTPHIRARRDPRALPTRARRLGRVLPSFR